MHKYFRDPLTSGDESASEVEPSGSGEASDLGRTMVPSTADGVTTRGAILDNLSMFIQPLEGSDISSDSSDDFGSGSDSASTDTIFFGICVIPSLVLIF